MRQLGLISQKAGDFVEAERLYREALATNEKIGDVRGVQGLLESFGDLAETRQDFTEAERLYGIALTTSLNLKDQKSECELSVRMGRLAARAGDTQKMIEYYGRYLKLARKMNLPLLADVVREYEQVIAKRFNPFVVGGPVRDDEFFSRNRELDELYRRVQRQQNVMLIGERGMGKTSLLFRLSQHVELPFISVFVDLQMFPGQAEDLLNGVVRRIVKAMLGEGVLSSERWGKYSLTYASDFSKALESMLDEAKEKHKDVKIVLILDEAERLLELGDQIGGVLRATLTMSRDIVAIISGSGRLLKVLKMPDDALGSPLLNMFTRLTLAPLGREDTDTLIREPSKQVGVSYEPGALESIYELSGGIPVYAQAVGSELIDMANQEGKKKISSEDVKKIVPATLEKLSSAFLWSLGHLDEKERRILSMMTSGGSMKEAGKQDIRGLESSQLIVEENGSYRFVSGLFEEWFKRYATAQ